MNLIKVAPCQLDVVMLQRASFRYFILWSAGSNTQ